jgi:hypothetical protein
MSIPSRAIAVLGLVVLSTGSARAELPPVAPAAAAFFESKVRPVLVEHCLGCHGPGKQRGGLRLVSLTGG